MAIIIALITFVLLSNAFSAWLGLSFFSWLFNVSLVTKGTVLAGAFLITVTQGLIIHFFAINHKETNQ